MADVARDLRIRQRTFEWLQEQVELHGDVLPRDLLAQGFDLEGEQIRLIGPQGIFRPQCMGLPLSTVMAPASPYADEVILRRARDCPRKSHFIQSVDVVRCQGESLQSSLEQDSPRPTTPPSRIPSGRYPW